MWTEEAILDDDGQVLLDVEAVQQEVDDYAQKAYKAAKANKDVSRAPMAWVRLGRGWLTYGLLKPQEALILLLRIQLPAYWQPHVW